MAERIGDGEHHYYEHARDDAPRYDELSVTWTERDTAWLELPDGSWHEVDVDPRPKIGFHHAGD